MANPAFFQGTSPSMLVLASIGLVGGWLLEGRADGQTTGPSASAPGTATQALDFELPDAWSSVPFEFQESDWQELTNYNRYVGKKPWTVPPVSRDDIARGVTLSTAHVKRGKYSGEWKDHPRYPTIACRMVPPDWSGSGAIRFSIWSEAATGEIITLGVRSDSPATPALDYFTHDIAIDWTGWKEITVPFSDFQTLGQPAGWNQVDGIFFFTKMACRSPDPRTDLFFDAMELVSLAKGAATAPSPASTPSSDIFFTVCYTHDAPVALNHDGPEVLPSPVNTAPFVQTPFFQGVRAREGYLPRYDPGYASFDPKGHAWIQSPGLIESLGADGKWQKHDLSGVLKDFARQQGWAGIGIAWAGDPTIRFDSDGDIYALEDVKHLDADGKEPNAQDRVAVLLHSRDQGQTWTTQALPGRMADFEKIDGHNPDALKNPPVIVLSDARYFPWADQDGWLVVPEKKSDGTVFLPPKIRFAQNVLTGPVHSGGGNFALSQGDKIFVVFGCIPTVSASNNSTTDELRAVWAKDLPPIPADHPARQMHFPYPIEKKEASAANGVPTFIVAYDRKTKTLSAPVFLGYGGRVADGHNWAAISADSKGILHVVINGHIDPLVYTHSLRPGDISAWSDPVYLSKAPDSTALAYVSYASLTCDRDDNLFCVVRSDTNDYNHRLAVLRKPAGQPWEKEQNLVIPFSGGYHVWTNKVSYDVSRNRLFIGYYDQPNQIQFTRANYLFYRFYWPDIESTMTAGAGKRSAALNGGLPEGKKLEMFMPGPCEFVLMFTDDIGKSWHLATTPDFEPSAKH